MVVVCWQYTCFTVSEQFIMIGTNTGGVYVFYRKSRQFVSILPGQVSGWGIRNCWETDVGGQFSSCLGDGAYVVKSVVYICTAI